MFEWPIQRSDCGACGTRIRFRDFVCNTRCAAFSAIRKRASLPSHDAQKNDLRLLRSSAFRVVRPAHATRSRSLLRGCAYLPGVRTAACVVPALWHGEAGEASLVGEQPVLYQALCLLCRTALPDNNDLGCGARAASGLARGQGTGQAIHAGTVAPHRHAWAEGHRHRRDIDPQGAYLSYRGERSHPEAPIWFGARTDRRRAWRSAMTGWETRKPKAFAWR